LNPSLYCKVFELIQLLREVREASFEASKTRDNFDEKFYDYFWKAMSLAKRIELLTEIPIV